MSAMDDDDDRADAAWDRELEFRKRRNEARDPMDPACDNFGESDEEQEGDE